MRKYVYDYQTVVNFSRPVTNHSVLLRCQPVADAYMRIEEEHLVVPPEMHIRQWKDQFGNRIAYGGRRDAHSALAYVSVGIVSMLPYKVDGSRDAAAMYVAPTGLTALAKGWKFSGDGGVMERVERICHAVHERMTYSPCSTDVGTSAAEVAQTLSGVCQDYAHLMIGLCRSEGIAARYVCGFLEGTGATHAWVEVLNNGTWYGFDPTHDRYIEYGYVKLAHGRDAADCPVSRGLYAGDAVQQTYVNVTLKEI